MIMHLVRQWVPVQWCCCVMSAQECNAHLRNGQLLLHALQLCSSDFQAGEGLLSLHCCFSLCSGSTVSSSLQAYIHTAQSLCMHEYKQADMHTMMPRADVLLAMQPTPAIPVLGSTQKLQTRG